MSHLDSWTSAFAPASLQGGRQFASVRDPFDVQVVWSQQSPCFRLDFPDHGRARCLVLPLELWEEEVTCIIGAFDTRCTCGESRCAHAAAILTLIEERQERDSALRLQLLAVAEARMAALLQQDEEEADCGAPATLQHTQRDLITEAQRDLQLLTPLDMRRSSFKGPLARWLRSHTPGTPASAPAPERLRYVLDSGSHPAALLLGLFLSKPLKKPGQYSRGRRVMKIYQASKVPDLDAIDQQILPLLAACEQHFIMNAQRFRITAHQHAWLPLDQHCQHLLDLLMESGRCLWRSPVGPVLRRGPDEAGHLCWRQNQRGLWHLEPVSGTRQALPLEPPWYVDDEQGLLGRLVFAERQSLLSAATDLPAVEEAELPAVCRLLKQHGCTLPPPIDLPDLTTPVDGQAVALFTTGILRVSDRNFFNRWTRPCRMLQPAMRYGNELVPLTGRHHESVSTSGIVIERDPVEEQRLLDTLPSFDLLREDAGTHSFTLNPAAPPNGGPRFVPDVPILRKQSSCEPDLALIDFPPALPARLIAAGWELLGIEAPEEAMVGLADCEAHIAEEDDHDWFRLDLGVCVGAERVDLLPALRDLVRGEDWRHKLTEQDEILVPLADGRLLRAPSAPLYRILTHLHELFERTRGDDTLIDAGDAGLLDELAEQGLSITGAQRLREQIAGLRALAETELPEVPVPAGFAGTLRPYQERGLAWFQALAPLGLGGLLADDMGLGKTVQCIAHCCAEVAAGRLTQGALIICPRSMLGTWRREFARFAPQIPTVLHHGTGRDWSDIAAGDVALTTYATATRDAMLLHQHPFDLVVCDEAQALKNTNTKTYQALSGVTAGQRIALTGTPMENHLGELWALMHWLNPGLLGRRSLFDRHIRRPIEREGDSAAGTRLRQRIAPVLLRRSKEQVATELPAKTESTLSVSLGSDQRALYESIRVAMDDKVREAINAKGLAQSGLVVLEALMRLRQSCCDPGLIDTPQARACNESAKLDLLDELLPTLVEDGRRILLFSSFAKLLDRIGTRCEALGIAYESLTGRTRKRQERIDRFQSGAFPLFLISLKAGGTGLTLTAADTVIHVDPWWNPAAEDQATDRAHRIGQDKPVLVYRLIAEGTVEERIHALQDRKRNLAAGLYDAQGGSGSRFSQQDIDELLRPLD